MVCAVSNHQRRLLHMRRTSCLIHSPLCIAAGVGGLFFALSPVWAQTTTVACGDTSQLPNPIYLAGSSAFEPILGQLSVQIRAKQGVSVIYSAIASCNGVSAISPPADLPTPQPLTGTAHYYTLDPTDNTTVMTNSCTLAGNTMASIGVSDVSFESCQSTARPASLGEWFGPEQAMLIVVPERNVSLTALSSQQAAAIWGCGQQGNQGPFVDETAIQQRSSTSGTQILVARNIGVPETAFKGQTNASSTLLVNSLLAVADPQTAIGFVANDFYATKRYVLNSVAFRGIGQKKAYYADSDSVGDDLLNVREGRYMIQGPLHYFAPMTNSAPSGPAATVLNWLTGSVPIDPADTTSYVRTVASLGDVPQCAMKVRIDKDGGLFSPYTPPVTCDCAFQKAKNLRLSAGTCRVCKTDSDCSGGLRCQTGYCE
jgi:hypothetical protein